jgi:hypothetical protein
MHQRWTREDQEVIFCRPVEWTFDREMSEAQTSEILAELSEGLAANDPSIRELAAYVMATATLVCQSPPQHMPMYATQSRAIWEREFASKESNPRGRMKAKLADIFASDLEPPASSEPTPEGAARTTQESKGPLLRACFALRSAMSWTPKGTCDLGGALRIIENMR